MRHENWQKGECGVYRYKLKRKIYIINYLFECVFFWMSVISKVFVSTLSMCLFDGKYIAQKLFLF